MKYLKHCIGCLLLIPLFLFAQETSSGQLSGLLFGDYYYEVSNHNNQLNDRNGFWIRRIYFKYTKNITDRLSSCLLFEMNTPDGFNKPVKKPFPFVKAAFLAWKQNQNQVLLGISLTPTYSSVLKAWGYRCVEKTPLDLHNFVHIVELGLAVKGTLGSAGKINYHLMLANGTGNKAENNEGKKVMLSVGFKPIKGFLIDVYGDWDNNPGKTDWYTFRGFASYQTAKLRLGLFYTHQVRQIGGGKDLKLNLGSAFAVAKLSLKSTVLFRIDRSFDPDPLGNTISYLPFDPKAKSTLFIAGWDYTIAPNVHLIPNLETIIYDKVNGVTPDKDILPRITFFYRF